jgi:hypothetical protein
MLRFNVIVVLRQRRLDFLNLELSQSALKLIAAAGASSELHRKSQLVFGAGILFIARARG